MIDDPDLRNIAVDTTGDFLAFELFDNGEWRQFGVSGTTLRILGGPGASNDLEAFEQNVERIKGVAFGISNVGNGRTMLSSEHFQ